MRSLQASTTRPRLTWTGRQLERVFAVASLTALFSAAAWPNACTLGSNQNLSTSGGHWTGTGCTGGAYIPAAPDTVTISDTYKLTVDQNWTIGSSPASNGTAAIYVGLTGVVEVAAGATLTSQGDFTSSASRTGGTNYGLILDAGSAFNLDSSAASSPTTTRYRVGLTGGSGTGRLVVQGNGSSGSHVIVAGRTATGLANGALAGQFRGSSIGGTSVTTGGTFYQFTYTDFSYIGDSTTHGEAFELAPAGTQRYTFYNCTFDHTSTWLPEGTLLTNENFDFNYNAFTSSLSYSNMMVSATTSNGTGDRNIIGNVFDKRWNDGDGNCNGGAAYEYFAFTGNYFGAGNCPMATYASAAPVFTNNFAYSPNNTVGPYFGIPSNSTGFYFFVDFAGANDYKPTGLSTAQITTTSNCVFEQVDDPTGQVGTFAPQWYYGHATSTVQNCIALPTKAGHAAIEIFNSTNTGNSTTYSIQGLHNTWTGGLPSTYSPLAGVNESGAAGGPFTALESNLQFSPAGTAYTKVWTINTSSMLSNAVTLADYNSADQYMSSTNPACGGCTNQGRGYAGLWSAMPGGHDITANPNFTDPLRNVPLWDTKYLGKAAGAAWAPGTVYSVGQVISDSNAGYYGGATVNFRCITAHTSGVVTEPNVGANWRTDWEFASLYDLRMAIGAGTTYNDAAIACAGCSAVQALVNWIRKGFVPQNPALWCAGHDGETIGAVPFCASGKAMLEILPLEMLAGI